MFETNLILFLAASLVVIVAPGPDNILVLTRGITLGRRAALVSAANPWMGRSFTILLPMVLMIFQPPDMVPMPIAVAQASFTQMGTSTWLPWAASFP